MVALLAEFISQVKNTCCVLKPGISLMIRSTSNTTAKFYTKVGINEKHLPADFKKGWFFITVNLNPGASSVLRIRNVSRKIKKIQHCGSSNCPKAGMNKKKENETGYSHKTEKRAKLGAQDRIRRVPGLTGS